MPALRRIDRQALTRVLSPETVLATARSHGFRLDVDARTAVDSTGADFLVVRAMDEDGVEWILRSPRRPDVLDRAGSERRALELVRPHLPIAVPDWRVFTSDLIAYPLVVGEPAATIDMDAGGYVWRFDETAPPTIFLDSLAGALAALHRIDPADAASAGLRVQDSDDVRRAYSSRMEIAREMLDVPDSLWRRWRDWIADPGYWPDCTAVIHGDLHPPHILVDARDEVVGLIDWTECQVGDPAADFTLQFATLGAEVLADLLQRYEAAGGIVWDRMPAHIAESWAAYPALIAEFAATSGEEGPRLLAQTLVDASTASG